MKFTEIVKQQAAHKLMHAGGEKGEEEQDLSCQTYYPTKDIIKHGAFDQFWRLIDQMNLSIEAYSG